MKVARDYPRTLSTLLGKIQPTQIEGDAQGPIIYKIITIITNVTEPDEEPSRRAKMYGHEDRHATGN